MQDVRISEERSEVKTKDAEIITFKFLRELQKKERDSIELQALPPNFFNLVEDYLSRKNALAKKDAAFAEEGVSKELVNLLPVVKYIFERREQKIVLAAIKAARSDIKIKNLLPQEEQLFDKLVVILKNWRQQLDGITGLKREPKESKPQKSQKENLKSLRLKFLVDVPAFVAEDLESYGPFKAGQQAEIPEKTAAVLVRGKKAERI